MTYGGPVAVDDLDEYVAREMQGKNIPAAVIVVLRDGVVVAERAYGTVNIEFSVPAALEDVYPLASITKLFTAAAVFVLVQGGALRLDSTVVSLLPRLPAAWRDVTVLHCLSHTSGIPDFPQIYDSPDVPASEEAAVGVISSAPLAYPTGEQCVYNQAEFLLLKMIVERVSATTFAKFMQREIFVPAGITSARFGDSREIVPRGVPVYTRARPTPDRFHSTPLDPFVNKADDPLFHATLLYPSYTQASAGLSMTGPDLARLDSLLQAGTVLGEEMIQRMWEPIRLRDGSLGDFTAGWQYINWNDQRVVGHIGAGMSVYASLVDHGVTLVLLTNVQETRVWDLARGMLSVYVPEVQGRNAIAT
jgi:CubicO group peptidase (beta-lactamase class C family)